MNSQIHAKLRATGQETTIQDTIHLHVYGQELSAFVSLAYNIQTVNLLQDNVRHRPLRGWATQDLQECPQHSQALYKCFLSQQSQMNTNFSCLKAFFACFVSFWF